MRATVSLTNPAMLNVSEFTLTIALVVFVMLTAILLLIVILLCASKSFRAFFFRDAAKKKKTAEKKKQAAALAQARPTREKQTAREPAAETPAQTITRGRLDRSAAESSATRSPRASRKKEPDIFEGVQTVPLDGLPVARPATGKRGGKRASVEYGNTSDDVPTVIIPQTKTPSDESKKNTFIARSITITRAKTSKSVQNAAPAGRSVAAAKQADEKPAKKQTPAASSDKSTPKKR